MAKFPYEVAACVLIEALFTTDADASAKYGITPRTLNRYRQRLGKDPILEAVFQTKKSQLDEKWAETLPAAMREAIRAIAEISNAMRTDPAARRNPFTLEKLAGALKLCAEVYYTGKIIDDRLAQHNRPQGQLLGSGVAESDSEYPN